MPQYDDGNDVCPNQEKEENNEEDDSNENGAADFESTDFTSDEVDPQKQGFGEEMQQGLDDEQEPGWGFEEPADSQGSEDPEVKQEYEEPAVEQEQFEEAQEQPEVKQPKAEQSQEEVTSVKGESCSNLKYLLHLRSRFNPM